MGRETRRIGGLSLLGPLLLVLLTWAATLPSAQGQEGSADGPTYLSPTHLSPMDLSVAPEQLSTAEQELRAIADPTVEDLGNSTQMTTSNYTGLNCVSLLPPRRGSFYVEQGTGVSVGTVLAFWCREGFQLVGSERLSCILRSGAPKWSNYQPVCEAIPKPEDRGLRVAVLASVVSGIVILAMSVSFIICCLQERTSKDGGCKDTRSSSRRRDKLRHSSRRSDCWLERDDSDCEAFPPPKIFHLTPRYEPHYPPNSPLYVGGIAGYDNRGYLRSQENLLKAPLPGLYRTESQMYPHMVLQRVPTPTAPTPSAPTAPLYLHLQPQPTDSSAAPTQVLSPYHKPSYHSPNGTPQRLWQ
ncbi:uncharacterized protein zgc:162331 [Alosa sapidissima]|uniref:uncharacterized protein zgc:162331 n=1 Tax=Alosa sapidissima TaxID=34773 RepID=UPI001C087AA0|nr:uncharacterized protein zgc:162331 [Alosa sapidissima]